MSKDSEKVTIIIIDTVDDQNEEDNSEDDSDYDSEDNSNTEDNTVQKKEKIPLSKRFRLNRGGPEITNLHSLINIFDHPQADKQQGELVSLLKELDAMIGMEKFKEQLINQILFFVQDLQDPQTFLHTVITGPPGTGKTQAINILAKIYNKLGILESDKVIKADRSSLIGKWLGSTSIKTKKVLDSAKGGVLIIDEVYSIGTKTDSDTYSKECIDTINQYLSEHVDDFICVVAGYKDLVQECFFDINPGLDRRFPWRFTIDPYTPEELTKIMKNQMFLSSWKLDETVNEKYISDLIRNNRDHFKGNGGDTKNLLDRCKIANARRVFTENNDDDMMQVEDYEKEETPVKNEIITRSKAKFLKTPVASKKRKTVAMFEEDMKKRQEEETKKELQEIKKSKTNKIITKKDIDNGLKSFLESKLVKEREPNYAMYS